MAQILPPRLLPGDTIAFGAMFVFFALYCPFLTVAGVSLPFAQSLLAIPILFLAVPGFFFAMSFQRRRPAVWLSFAWAAVYAVAFVLTVISIPYAGRGVEMGVGWWQLGFGTSLMVIGGWMWMKAPATPG